MGSREHSLRLRDYAPERAAFLGEVRRGLALPQKELPCKFFYDERGSALFERICELEEYYPTRTELAILERHVGEMARAIGPGCLMLEYGSGSSKKTRILLDHLEEPVGYVPIDISREHLWRAAAALAHSYPQLEVLPVCADYTGEFELPRPPREPARRLIYFPGSTIGNFDRAQTRRFLDHAAAVCGAGGALLIGVDLKKDVATLERAYNDAEGVTAAFNRNLLTRINRELGADFDPERFAHRAFYDAEHGRIEMHLVSVCAQRVRIDGTVFDFAADESIRTENSHKYGVAEFAALAAGSGFEAQQVWTDPEQLFSVQLLVRSAGTAPAFRASPN